MKGIILAGGTGSRLFPATLALSKQLLPVFDKPMIYYPLSVLMLAGLREILVITTPDDRPAFQRLLGDGRQWGIALDYAVQDRPRGIAEALLIGRAFLAGAPVALILGDNLFYGQGLSPLIRRGIAAAQSGEGATLFAYRVPDPQRYGTLVFDATGRPVDIVEKPSEPPSSLVVTGLYMYDGDAPDAAGDLVPSARGELEITDLNRRYLAAGRCRVERLGRGFAWFDAGTHASLLQAAQFVQTVQDRQGLRIGSVEETAWRMGLIDDTRLGALAAPLRASGYGAYLNDLLDEESDGGVG